MMIFMNYNMKRIDYQICVRKNKIENALSNLKCEKKRNAAVCFRSRLLGSYKVT